jgi:hypothetical protein
LNRFPLWPVTLITTTLEKNRLESKVQQIASQLNFPICVMDLQQAKQMLEQVQPNVSFVSPEHWAISGEQASFIQWKASLTDHAKKLEAERLETEQALNFWQQANYSFQQFFEKYPYEEKQLLDEKVVIVCTEVEKFENSAKRLQKEMQQIQQDQELLLNQVEEKMAEFINLEAKISIGRKYEAQYREYRTISIQMDKQKQSILNVQKRIDKTNLELKRFQEEKVLLNSGTQSLNHEISSYKQRLSYSKVANSNLRPIFSERLIEVLEIELEGLERKREKIQQSRGELEARYLNSIGLIKRAESDMKQFLFECEELDKTVSYSINLDHEIDQAQEVMRRAHKLVDQTRSELEQARNEESEIRGTVNILKKGYVELFPTETIRTFSVELRVEKQKLADEKKKLRGKEKILLEEFQQYEQLEKHFEEVIQSLRVLNGEHKFESPSITETKLSTDDKHNFTYHLDKLIAKLSHNLTKHAELVIKEKDAINQKRSAYFSFLNDNMKDVRMKENIQSGILNKHSYDDLVQFKNNIQNKIRQIVKISEESMRGYDQDLEVFITHMMQRIQTVLSELAEIPGKTKIKISDQTKQIYDFKLPVVEEDIGKERLREHIDHVLTLIERPHYFDADGKIVQLKRRSDIEKWFETPHLMKVVFVNEEMRVTCRKVKNDHEVTTKPYSWQQSNTWSGGEKWSKNMTLFLGLLNYVAEKKKLMNTSMKRNRVVILDNPFGKASSEHVLSPVFFIAEKLGFQMIALTAHAEGKFLRDYFPVIYSCRLRTGKDSAKQVMTKQKYMNHAFFQDHEPVAIERLGESQQLDLFK